MKTKFLIFVACMLSRPMYADVLDLDVALNNVHINCYGISDELAPMKKLAGINTAVTGVGTLAGGGAIATGFVKSAKDKETEKHDQLIAELENAGAIEITSEEMFYDKFSEFLIETEDAESIKIANNLKKRKAELEIQSNNLGNWRTGLMAGNTATNIAGAIIAHNNRVDKDLQTMVNDCENSINDLRQSVMQARIDGTDVTYAQNIINACSGYDTLDVSKINKRADGAKWSAIAGVAVGATGTVTSAMANTDKTRNDNTESGKSREKNLNTASNMLAIGATVASATSTIFNATQISAIKKASDITDRCERALK